MLYRHSGTRLGLILCTIDEALRALKALRNKTLILYTTDKAISTISFIKLNPNTV